MGYVGIWTFAMWKSQFFQFTNRTNSGNQSWFAGESAIVWWLSQLNILQRWGFPSGEGWGPTSRCSIHYPVFIPWSLVKFPYQCPWFQGFSHLFHDFSHETSQTSQISQMLHAAGLLTDIYPENGPVSSTSGIHPSSPLGKSALLARLSTINGPFSSSQTC